MDVEILTIGDELLLGQTIDTNSAYIARQISAIGLLPLYKSSVGDTINDIETAIKLATKRAGLVIATGGLGPTADDNTKKAIVKIFRRNLVLDDRLLEDIRARYRKRGIEMPAINENQALIPSGSQIFKNAIGSAVGIGIIGPQFIFIALPGVPTEMKYMLDQEIIPFLAAKKIGVPVRIITIKTTGICESQLAEIIVPELTLGQDVKLAYLPGFSGVDLRVVGAGADQAAAEENAQKVVDYISNKIGKYIYGQNDDTLPSVIGQLLKKKSHTLAVAESCTGGQLGELITTVSGSSDYFQGGIIAYANDVKQSQLGVGQDTLAIHGAVSEQCAVEMAIGCRNRFNCDYALSITGIAGPDGGTPEKPVGTTYIGLSSRQNSFAKQFNLGAEREMIRSRACYVALEMLRREILDIK